jgi:hypothetical protein
MVGRTLVSWLSKMQESAMLHSMEAKDVTLSPGAMEIKFPYVIEINYTHGITQDLNERQCRRYCFWRKTKGWEKEPSTSIVVGTELANSMREKRWT